MKKKVNRLQAIKEIIINTRVGSQEELLQLLSANGYNLTQATLSRDLKQLKIAKVPGNDGGYVYVLPEVAGLGKIMHAKMISPHTSFAGGFISINFSGNLAVIKTRPGYAEALHTTSIPTKKTLYWEPSPVTTPYCWYYRKVLHSNKLSKL